MPFLTKDKLLLQGFSSKPYTGLTKTDDHEYSVLQNVSGFGGFGAKRRGIQGMATLSSGILGIFDLKVDGDADSPDRFMVYLYNGTVVIYEPSELTVLFEYLFESTITINLQAPNLTCYSLIPDTSDGTLILTEIATPGTLTSSDLFVSATDLLGFVASTSKIYRLMINTSITPPALAVREYGTASSVTSYSTALSFAAGYGPIFQSNDLINYRLGVNNSAELILTEV